MYQVLKTTDTQTVSNYLAKAPAIAKPHLRTLRAAIRATAPKAEEVISYRMPVYKQQGMLCAFGAFTHHASFFGMSRSVLSAYKKELAGYKTSAGTLQIPYDKKVPVALIKKLVRTRLKENAARAEVKTKKRYGR